MGLFEQGLEAILQPHTILSQLVFAPSHRAPEPLRTLGDKAQRELVRDLSRGRLKASRAAVVAALQGRVTPHHRFLLRLHLTQIDALEVAVRDVEARLGEALAPFQAAVDRLMTIPAIGRTVARLIVAEIGVDMGRFPTAGHLVSWAGLCPRQQESAGKRLSTRTRHGNPWLKTTLVQVA